ASSRTRTVSQRDITRAVKGAQAAGMQVNEVVCLPNGEIRLRNKAADGVVGRDNDFDGEFG
ncbi:hypothetical protein ACSTLD_24135, partial [Vibrio parahaemolyticus]